MSPHEEMLYIGIRLLTCENFFYVSRCFLNVFKRMADKCAVTCSSTFYISNIGDYAFIVQMTISDQRLCGVKLKQFYQLFLFPKTTNHFYP